MKKGFLATLFAALLAVVCVTPAFAAELNAGEQKVYDEFVNVVDKYMSEANLDADHAGQYKNEARSALLKVDLNDTACSEFSQVVKNCDNILSGSKTRAALKSHASELLSTINGVAGKYGMSVSLDSKNYAIVTVTQNGKSSVVADTSKTVKQTGVDATQTALVAAGAAAVLGIGFVLVRKNHLFE